jgi:hypothetical protein
MMIHPAAHVIKQLPLTYVRWIVVFAVLYTSVMLLRSAAEKSAPSATEAPEPAAE